jgi:hypothetical protein
MNRIPPAIATKQNTDIEQNKTELVISMMIFNIVESYVTIKVVMPESRKGKK